jgi:hypothetical protein
MELLEDHAGAEDAPLGVFIVVEIDPALVIVEVDAIAGRWCSRLDLGVVEGAVVRQMDDEVLLQVEGNVGHLAHPIYGAVGVDVAGTGTVCVVAGEDQGVGDAVVLLPFEVLDVPVKVVELFGLGLSDGDPGALVVLVLRHLAVLPIAEVVREHSAKHNGRHHAIQA